MAAKANQHQPDCGLNSAVDAGTSRRRGLRRLLASCSGRFALGLALCIALAGQNLCGDDAPNDKTALRVRPEFAGQITTRADFSGNLIVEVTHEDATANEAVPLTVAASFKCNQTPAGQTDAIRRYESASATITLNGQSTENQLASGNRQIAARLTMNRLARPVTYLSVGGVLRQTEQDLLLLPCDPLTFSALFSRETVHTGDRWKVADDAARAFLALDNLVENRLDLLVKEITASTIKVYLMGNVRGEIETALTDLQIVGVAVIDRKTESVQALRITIDEKRQVSQIAPGFAGQVKLDVRSSVGAAEPASTVPVQQVSRPKVQQLPLKLLWNTDSQFEMVYDPQWRVIISDPDAVVLRYIRQGNLLAQCSILRLPKRPADRPLQLNQFKEEIAKMVAESQARIVGGDVVTTRSGLTAIRVAVAGQQDGLGVQWRYYHLSNPDGRCIALVFTAEDEAAAAFGNADQQLLESVRFPALPPAPASREANAASPPPARK